MNQFAIESLLIIYES